MSTITLPPDASDINRVAQQIENYLASRAGAADTLRGIVQWWLMQQRIFEAEQLVEQAMKSLHQSGKIKCRQMADGTELFYYPKDSQPSD